MDNFQIETAQNITIQQKRGDVAPYIYATIANIGGPSANSGTILGIQVEEIVTDARLEAKGFELTIEY